jgi:type II secretory pathway component PulK
VVRSVLLGIAVVAVIVPAVAWYVSGWFPGTRVSQGSQFFQRLVYFGAGLAIALYVVLRLTRD